MWLITQWHSTAEDGPSPSQQLSVPDRLFDRCGNLCLLCLISGGTLPGFSLYMFHVCFHSPCVWNTCFHWKHPFSEPPVLKIFLLPLSHKFTYLWEWSLIKIILFRTACSKVSHSEHYPAVGLCIDAWWFKGNAQQKHRGS